MTRAVVPSRHPTATGRSRLGIRRPAGPPLTSTTRRPVTPRRPRRPGRHRLIPVSVMASGPTVPRQHGRGRLLPLLVLVLVLVRARPRCPAPGRRTGSPMSGRTHRIPGLSHPVVPLLGSRWTPGRGTPKAAVEGAGATAPRGPRHLLPMPTPRAGFPRPSSHTRMMPGGRRDRQRRAARLSPQGADRDGTRGRRTRPPARVSGARASPLGGRRVSPHRVPPGYARTRLPPTPGVPALIGLIGLIALSGRTGPRTRPHTARPATAGPNACVAGAGMTVAIRHSRMRTPVRTGHSPARAPRARRCCGGCCMRW